MGLYERLFKKKEEEYLVTSEQVEFIENVNEISLFKKGAIIYVEHEFDEDVNNYIRNNIGEIHKMCNSKGLHLVYLPLIYAKISQTSLGNSVKYFYPHNKKAPVLNKSINKNRISTAQLTKSIFETLNFKGEVKPGFVRYKENNEYSYIKILTDSEDVFLKNFESYIFHCQDEFIKFRLVSSYQLLKGGMSDEVADCNFDSEAQQIADEIKEKIGQLKSQGYYQLLINTLSQSLNDVNLSEGNIIKQLQQQTEPTISRLKVDEDFRLFLPDYNNLEIKLTPLPKTVYLFFLRHPEGVIFKHLIDHKHELLYIYKLISNRESENEMIKSIEELIDPTKNSINEKCSRIKEAFIKHFEDDIARHYYITGGRGKEKSIALDSSLIIWQVDEKGLPNAVQSKNEEEYNQVIEKEKQYLNEGLAFLEVLQPDKALNYFNKVLDKNPYHYNTLAKRAVAYFDLKEYEKAIADNTKAIEMNYLAKIPYHNRSEAYLMTGEYNKAITDINYYLKKCDNQCPESYFIRGNIKEKMGNIKGACQDWYNAKSLKHPDANDALKRHGKFRILRVKLDKRVYG